MTDANTALINAHLDAMDDECPDCGGTGEKDCPECGGKGYDPIFLICRECGDRGVVPCEHDDEDEPDGDYLYEQMRDRRMEDDR